MHRCRSDGRRVRRRGPAPTSGSAGTGTVNVLVEAGGHAELTGVAEQCKKDAGIDVNFVELPYDGMFNRLSSEFPPATSPWTSPPWIPSGCPVSRTPSSPSTKSSLTRPKRTLQNIPADLIEAARLDGARAPAMLFRIILPLLRPLIAVALVVRGIDAARAFNTILIQTNDGPQSASETMSLLIYRTMIRFGDPRLASAMGTLYLLAMLAVAFVAVTTIWRPGKDN